MRPLRSRYCRRWSPSSCWRGSRRSRRLTRSWSRSCWPTRSRSFFSLWSLRARSGGWCRRGGAGAPRRGLHVRIVALFSVIAAVPAVLVAVVASVTLDRGLDRLFSQQTHSLIENSLIVADAYVREHVQFVRADSIAIAIELARAKPLFDQSREQFHQFLAVQASIRGLPAVMLLDKDLNVIDEVESKVTQAFVKPSRRGARRHQRHRAASGDVPRCQLRCLDHQAARLRRHLSVHCARCSTRACSRNCERHRPASRNTPISQRAGSAFRSRSRLMYTVIALIVLLSAVWIGLNFANYLVAPIRRLIGAAQVVSTGNLYVQVPTRRSEGDLAQLGETFNKMTQELRTQRDDIVRARDLIDSRRRFTEAVLAGASAGVIGVDAESCISILNRSAERLIGQFGGRGARTAADRDRPRACRYVHDGALRAAAPGAGPGDDQSQRPRAQSLGARHERAVGRGRRRLCGDARRYHRARGRAAHLRLGRRRAPHRARDQEPAHADPALRRAAAAQIRQRDQG